MLLLVDKVMTFVLNPLFSFQDIVKDLNATESLNVILSLNSLNNFKIKNDNKIYLISPA